MDAVILVSIGAIAAIVAIFRRASARAECEDAIADRLARYAGRSL